ncbi:MAG: ribosome recycling factor [candidate division WOR-3 bacterium]
MNEVFKDAERRMREAVEHLKREYKKLRAGRANPAILEGVKVNYYGQLIPINQIASITAAEGRLLIINPWDANSLPEIERAIIAANLNLTPKKEGKVLKIEIPPLSEERRKELVKLAKQMAEEAKIHIRNIRRDAIEKIREMEKNKEITEDDRYRGEENIQKITDKFIEEVDKAFKEKEKEILEE